MKTFWCWFLANFPSVFIILGIFFGAYIGENNIVIADILSDNSIATIYFIVSAIFSFLLSLGVTVYVYRNIDEVISRRFKWGNSNVGKFDFRLKYSLRQGALFFIGFSLLFIDISFLLKS